MRVNDNANAQLGKGFQGICRGIYFILLIYVLGVSYLFNIYATSWLSDINTIEFLGIWEQLHNPGFKVSVFEKIKHDVTLNHFVLIVKRSVNITGALGFKNIDVDSGQM
jgi:hypothetical protein